MYGVLFALSLELLPIKARGTGYAMVFIVNCICNAMVRVSVMFQKYTAVISIPMQASIIGLYANINTPLPLWFSGAVLVLAGFIALFLPIEPRGDASLES